MDNQFETIHFCESSIEAEMLRLKLANAGIEAHVLDDSSAISFGGWSPGKDGIRLQVNATDLAQAEAVLQESEKDKDSCE